MLSEIEIRFRENIDRVQNLITIYKSHLQTSGSGRKPNHSTDLLRAALVLLHATLEDTLRKLMLWQWPLNAGRDDYDKIPIVSQDGKHASKFFLGELFDHRGKTVKEILEESFESYLETSTSFNDYGQVASALQKCGLPEAQIDTQIIEEMIKRRHNIVHKADENPTKGGSGNYNFQSIGVLKLESYVAEVERLFTHIQASLRT